MEFWDQVQPQSDVRSPVNVTYAWMLCKEKLLLLFSGTNMSNRHFNEMEKRIQW